MRFLASLILAASAALLAANPPNIVLIISDDHGTDDLGAYGNTAIHTPALDRLATEGVLFHQAYTTAASCTPSRSTLQSGLHNHANGLFGLSHHYHHFRAFEGVETLPVLLSQLGEYATGRVGKYHVAPESVYHYETAIPSDVLNPVDMAEQARTFIAENRDQPSFLYYATIAPHRSGTYREDLPHRPNDFHNKREGYPGVEPITIAPEDVIVPPYLPDSPASRQELAQYYQAVARVDQGVARLREILEENDAWDNTLVLYLTDNGIAFPGAKTNLYQGALRLPLIVKLPGSGQAGTETDAMISWVDITPTLLDYAGVLDEARARIAEDFEANRQKWDNVEAADFHGTSFRAVLEDPTGDHQRDEVYASHTFHEVTMYYPMRAVITRDLKLIWNIAHELPYPHALDLWHAATWQYALNNDGDMGVRTTEEFIHRPEFELFDLSKDPWESTNLAEDPAYTEALAKMKAKLRDFQKRTNDPWELKWDRE